MKPLLLLILGGSVVVLIFWFFMTAGAPETNEPEQPRGSDGETATEPLVSAEYQFLLHVPNGWEATSAPLADGTPAFSVYVPESGEPEAPYTHHHNVTNVSVFPNGVPTEGLFADRMPPAFDPGFMATNTIMFVLEDGTPFAAYLQPLQKPESWGDAGFVWVRVHLDRVETTCFDRAGVEVEPEACDPLTEGHRVVWNGNIESGEWEEALRVLQSFEFTE